MICRMFSALKIFSPQFQRTYSIQREARFLGKILNAKKKKRWNNNYNTLPAITKFSNPSGQPGKSAKKRVSVLNKLFMRYITDLMANGSSVSDDIHGRGIEISKVNITTDFNLVNVYWLSKSEKVDAELENLLKSIAGRLRHELSQLKIMGVVPMLSFVKDDELSRQRKLDEIFTTADYGEDYDPPQMGQALKDELTSSTVIPASVKEKIRDLDKLENLEDETLPKMTNYVYGLDHDKVMGRILAALNANKAAWERDANPEHMIEEERRLAVIKNETDSASHEMQHSNLAKFLKQRQILHREMFKRKEVDKAYQKEMAEKTNYNEYEEDNFDNLDEWMEGLLEDAQEDWEHGNSFK